MLSLLDTINHFLGYFNINSKPKNRVYTVIAAIGNFYLLYLAVHALRYQYWLRGFIYLGIFLVLLYFCVLNVIYYFTQKTSKFDISPKIEKLLGGPPKGRGQSPDNQSTQNNHVAPTKIRNIPTAGVFSENSLVPAEITSNNDEQVNLNLLIDTLDAQDLANSTFKRLSEDDIRQQLNQNQKVEKIDDPLDLPFYDLQIQPDHVEVLAGLNALTAKPIGRISRVGLSSIEEALQNYDLALAELKVYGGPQKVLNANRITEVPTPYKLQGRVAFKPKQRANNDHQVQTVPQQHL